MRRQRTVSLAAEVLTPAWREVPGPETCVTIRAVFAGGVNSAGRVPASQAGCRGFDPRTPLHSFFALALSNPAALLRKPRSPPPCPGVRVPLFSGFTPSGILCAPLSGSENREVGDEVDTQPAEHAKQADTTQVLHRLRRIEGQVRGLQRMIQEGQECEAVLTQLSAVKSALDRVGVFLITHRMRECLQSSDQTLDERSLEQAFEVFLRYSQSFR